MTLILHLIILALVQGITEFLPVSSSGHLVVAKQLLNLNHGIELEIWLHVATLAAVIVFFRRDLVRLIRFRRASSTDEPEHQWLHLILLSSVITGFLGILAKDFFESAYTYPKLVMVLLIINGLILFATKSRNDKNITINWKIAAILGAVQALAILPGISRSGITITCLFLLGVRLDHAFKYSFLASIPVIFGAFLLKLKDGAFASIAPLELFTSFVVAFFAGICALNILKRVMILKKFHVFGYYCILVGIIGLVLMIDISS